MRAGKRCPYCNTVLLVDPNLPPEKCSACGNIPIIQVRLRDTDRTRGGFTLEKHPDYNTDELRMKILSFIDSHPSSCIMDIARGLNKSRSFISLYVHKLEEDGLIIIYAGKKTRIVSVKSGIRFDAPLQKDVIKTFNALNRAAEININAMQRCKNAVTA